MEYYSMPLNGYSVVAQSMLLHHAPQPSCTITKNNCDFTGNLYRPVFISNLILRPVHEILLLTIYWQYHYCLSRLLFYNSGFHTFGQGNVVMLQLVNWYGLTLAVLRHRPCTSVKKPIKFSLTSILLNWNLWVVNTSQVPSCLGSTCKDQQEEIWQICDCMTVNDTTMKFVNF